MCVSSNNIGGSTCRTHINLEFVADGAIGLSLAVSVCQRTRRLERRREVPAVNHVQDHPTQRPAELVAAPWRGEVDGEVEALAVAGTHEPRTVVRAGGQLCRTDPRHEGSLVEAASDRRTWWAHPVADGT